MAYLLTAVIVIILVYCITRAATSDRYAKMTEKEFEAEAKRASLIGAGLAGLQRVIDPGHRVEYTQEAKQQAEALSADSGDRPSPGPASARKP